MGIENPGGLTRRFKAGVFANVLLIVTLGAILAIGVVALVRKISYDRDLRWDLTEDQYFSLDDKTKSMLRTLESPLEVVFVWGYDQDLENRVQDVRGRPIAQKLETYYAPILRNISQRVGFVLREWQSTSSEVLVHILNDEQDPLAATGIAQTFGVERAELLNNVYMRLGTRTRRIPMRHLVEDMEWGFFHYLGGETPPRGPGSWRIHEEFAATLKALLQGEAIRVGVPRALGAMIDPSGEAFAAYRQLLSAQGYEVQDLDLRNMEHIDLESVHALMLSAPRAPLEPHTRDLIQQYERHGGRLLIMLEPGRKTDLMELLEPFGVASRAARVQDSMNTRPGVGEGILFGDRMFVGSHAIDSPLKGRVELFMGMTRPLFLRPDFAAGSVRTPLLRGSPQAHLVPMTYDPRTGAVTPRSDRMEASPNPLLALALERPVTPTRKSRIVLFGTSEVFSPNALAPGRIYGNMDLFLNSLAWLTDREKDIGLAPRQEIEQRFIKVASLDAPVKWVGLVSLPMLALLASILIMMKRRN